MASTVLYLGTHRQAVWAVGALEALDKSLIANIILPDCRGSSESMASNCRSGYYTVTVRTLATDRPEGYAERGSGPKGTAKLGAREDLEGSNRKNAFPKEGIAAEIAEPIFVPGCTAHLLPSQQQGKRYPGAPPSLLMTKVPSAALSCQCVLRPSLALVYVLVLPANARHIQPGWETWPRRRHREQQSSIIAGAPQPQSRVSRLPHAQH